jgi:hypothetical protein
MKFASAILALFVSAQCSVFVSAMKDPATMMKIANDCKASTGASDNDVGQIMGRMEVSSKEGKCMINCLMENMEVVS